MTADKRKGEKTRSKRPHHGHRSFLSTEHRRAVLVSWGRLATRLAYRKFGGGAPDEEAFMKNFLCAVVLITGTYVFTDGPMKTAGDKVDKAAGATKEAVKKAAIEIADKSKKAARDISTATKKAASGTADTTRKATSKTENAAKKTEHDAAAK